MDLLQNGLPRDKTVCPACRNHPRAVVGCPVCLERGMVCPQCRGAGVVNTNRDGEQHISQYRACVCMQPELDPKTGSQARSKQTNRPLWRREPQREVDAILRYRDQHQCEEAH